MRRGLVYVSDRDVRVPWGVYQYDDGSQQLRRVRRGMLGWDLVCWWDVLVPDGYQVVQWDVR